ncbi:MAG: hypothetical protein ABSE77_16710 [Acidimicrobiales bacterium]|jgi:hypothetical protein
MSGALLALMLAAGGITMASPAGATAPRANTFRASGKTVSFSGHYQGDASLLINNGAVTISSVTGKGKGTLVGASTISGKGSASSTAQCDPFTGTGIIAGAAAKLNLHVVESKSSGCSSGESGPVTVTFTGLAVVTGGSAKASGASGSLKFNGTLKLGGTSGSQNGSYTVALTGKLTVKG